MNKIYIRTNQLKNDEINEINQELQVLDAELFGKKEMVKGFIPLDPYLVIIFELLQNMSYAAIYDYIKFVVMTILDKTNAAKKSAMWKITLRLDDKIVSMETNLNLTEKQKEKLIDGAIQKLLK